MNKVVNLTNHDINEVTSGNTYPPSGKVARANQTNKTVNYHDGIPIYSTVFEEKVDNLPDPVEGTLYIVSSLTLNAVPSHRTDVVSPGNARRDEDNNIIGCVGFRTQKS